MEASSGSMLLLVPLIYFFKIFLLLLLFFSSVPSSFGVVGRAHIRSEGEGGDRLIPSPPELLFLYQRWMHGVSTPLLDSLSDLRTKNVSTLLTDIKSSSRYFDLTVSYVLIKIREKIRKNSGKIGKIR